MPFLPTASSGASWHHFVNRLGGKRPRAIKCHSIVVLQKGHRFKRLPALSWPKDAFAQRAERLGRPRLKSLSHPRIARNAGHAVDRLHIVLGALFIKSE